MATSSKPIVNRLTPRTGADADADGDDGDDDDDSPPGCRLAFGRAISCGALWKKARKRTVDDEALEMFWESLKSIFRHIPICERVGIFCMRISELSMTSTGTVLTARNTGADAPAVSRPSRRLRNKLHDCFPHRRYKGTYCFALSVHPESKLAQNNGRKGYAIFVMALQFTPVASSVYLLTIAVR